MVAGRVDVVSEGGWGRGVEEGAEWEVEVEGIAEAGEELGSEEGVAAEVEEVIVDTDVGEVEDVGEGTRQQFLQRSARSHEGFLLRQISAFQLQKCPPVEFAVGEAGQCVQRDKS